MKTGISCATMLVLICGSSLFSETGELPLEGKAGLFAEYVATEDMQYYPLGGYAKIAYSDFENFTPYFQLKYNGNKRIFDGLGNIELIGVTDFNLGSEWDVTEDLSLEGFYRFALGTSNYIAHEGSLAFSYTGINLADFSVSANYVSASYVYPGTSTTLTNDTFSPDAEISFRLSDSLMLPIGFEYSAINYSTSDLYTMRIGHVGLDWDLNEKINLAANVSGGRDSSNYTIWGLDTEISYKFWKELTLSAWADYIQYLDTTKSRGGKGKRSITSGNTGGANNPLGSTDTFSFITFGLDLSYAF